MFFSLLAIFRNEKKTFTAQRPKPHFIDATIQNGTKDLKVKFPIRSWVIPIVT